MAVGLFDGNVNFKEFFLNDIAGGDEIILIGFLAVLILFFAAKFRFSNQVAYLMLGLAGLLFSVISQRIFIAVLFVLSAGFIIMLYKAIIKQE